MIKDKYKILKLILIIGIIVSFIGLYLTSTFNLEIFTFIFFLSFSLFGILNAISLVFDLFKDGKYRKVENVLLTAIFFLIHFGFFTTGVPLNIE